MKHTPQPPSKQNAIALGFTIGVHVIAVVGLLYLGTSKPLEPPKTIKTVLIKPEDLKPITREETEFTETASENLASEITQTALPVVDAANIPTPPVAPPPALAPEKPQVNQAKAAQEAKKAQEKAEQQAAEAAKRAEAAETAKVEAAKANAAAEKAQADAAKAKADAKNKAEQETAKRAELDAKQKADAAQKAKLDAQRKADAAEKTKADAAAKAKADAAAKAQADTEAKARAAEEAKASAAKQAAQEAAQKKAEATRIASTAKRDFENKIRRSWDPPMGSTGKKATARIQLDDNGNVRSVVVTSSDPDVKASVEAAIRAAAPYPMPSDPDARQQAKSVTSTFTAN